MREAFISDIHANPDRLYAALITLKRHGYDRMRCLGDVVSNSALKEVATHECVDLVTQNCDAVVLGNHDEIAGICSIFKTPCIKEFISNAKTLLRENDAVYVHAEPSYTNTRFSTNYVTTPERAAQIFSQCKDRLIFIGHTHIPAAFSSAGDFVLFEKGGTINLDKRYRWILSPGAVGKSRDRNPAPSCAIYDSGKSEFTVIRV